MGSCGQPEFSQETLFSNSVSTNSWSCLQLCQSFTTLASFLATHVGRSSLVGDSYLQSLILDVHVVMKNIDLVPEQPRRDLWACLICANNFNHIAIGSVLLFSVLLWPLACAVARNNCHESAELEEALLLPAH